MVTADGFLDAGQLSVPHAPSFAGIQKKICTLSDGAVQQWQHIRSLGQRRRPLGSFGKSGFAAPEALTHPER